MHPGQLLSHLLNTAIVTAVVAALVLWRYRVGVLAGMGAGDADELPLPQVEPRLAALTSSATDARAWEHRLTRRLVVAVVAAVLVAGMPLAYLLARSQLDAVTPLHVLADCGGFLIAALPMVAVLLALSFWRTVWFGVRLLAAMAIAVRVVSMLQRLATGRAPSMDQLLNAYFFLQVTVL